MTWSVLCRECFCYYEENVHTQKDLCYNCRRANTIVTNDEIRYRSSDVAIQTDLFYPHNKSNFQNWRIKDEKFRQS
jgi:hypothetical protein